MRLLGTLLCIFDACRYLCALILEIRGRKSREELFTILVKIKLLCNVLYLYEYGAGAMLSSSHTPCSCNVNMEQNSMAAKP
jgi:hypothetical protein